MNPSEIHEIMDKGIAAARAGNRQEAKESFDKVLGYDLNYLDAWLWLAGIAETPEKAIQCLGHALIIDPHSTRAQKGMEWALAWVREGLPEVEPEQSNQDSKLSELSAEIDSPNQQYEVPRSDLPSVRDLFTVDQLKSFSAAQPQSQQPEIVDDDWLDMLDEAFDQAAKAARGEIDDPPGMVPLEETLELQEMDAQTADAPPTGPGDSAATEANRRLERLWGNTESEAEEQSLQAEGSSTVEFSPAAMDFPPVTFLRAVGPGEVEAEAGEETGTPNWELIMEHLKDATPSSAVPADPAAPDEIPSLREQLESLPLPGDEEIVMVDPSAPDSVIGDLIGRGKGELAAGKLEEAIATLKEAVSLRPDGLDGHEQLGLAYYQSGMVDKALSEFEKLIQLKRDYPEAHANLGFLHTVAERYEEAVRSYREALKYDPDFTEAHVGLAEALRCQGKVDEAIDEWQTALALRLDLPDVHANLGEAYSAKGQFKESIEHYRMAVGYSPDKPNLQIALGQVLLKADELEQAAAAFDAALRLDPGLPEAHYNLGITKTMLGRREEAIAALEQAINLNPEYEPAKEALASITRKKDFSMPSRDADENGKQNDGSGWWPFRRRKK